MGSATQAVSLIGSGAMFLTGVYLLMMRVNKIVELPRAMTRLEARVARVEVAINELTEESQRARPTDAPYRRNPGRR